MHNFGAYAGVNFGHQQVTRNRFKNDGFMESLVETRTVFGDKAGRYIIFMGRQHYLTNNNQFEDREYTLDFHKRDT